jgi:hypothetical protein
MGHVSARLVGRNMTILFRASRPSSRLSGQNTGKNLIRASTELIAVQSLRRSDKLNICVIKIINNLLHTYDNCTGKYKILLNFF